MVACIQKKDSLYSIHFLKCIDSFYFGILLVSNFNADSTISFLKALSSPSGILGFPSGFVIAIP